jgi:hypothetical protein
MHRDALIAVCALVGLLVTGCDHPRQPGGTGSGGSILSGGTNLNAASFFGAANIRVDPAQCAGRIALTQGEATVHDECFSGDTNVVICTDATSASAVKCTPGAGALNIAGNANDMISYARLR